MIEIHEFSTGIEYEKTPLGGWTPQRLTREFINKTLDPIPQVIQIAINNQDFAIKESSATESPALIAREVGHNGDQWSVLAVIIGVSDGFSAYYRYFYSQSKGNIHHLVQWWIGETYPIFNPLETPEVRQYEPQKQHETPLDSFEDLLKGTAPIIMPNDRLSSPMIIHTIAEKIAGNDDIAWAWNVEELEYPQSFHVIYPHSPKAAQLISQAISPQLIPNQESTITEHDIKLAMQNLMNREEVKIEYLEVLETALGDATIDENLWLSLFDGRGVSVAISEKIYTAELIRLLTLRAIIIPVTLPEFLGWLPRNSKEKREAGISLKFQKQIIHKGTGKYPRITARVVLGVKLLILQLIEKPALLEATSWLLTSANSIWSNFYHHKVTKNIEHDLSLMSNFANDKKEKDFFKIPEWETIWSDIKVFWLAQKVSKMTHYLPLAKLFTLVGDYKIAAVFYQIATGSVPKLLFSKLKSNQRNKAILFKLKIAKSVSFIDPLLFVSFQIIKKVYSILTKIFYIIVPIILVLSFIVLVPLILSFFVYVAAIILSVVSNLLPILIVIGIISFFADH